MNELLTIRDDSRFPIDGRELHAKLGIESRYNDWFKRMCEYGFVENTDYETVLKNEYRADGALMPQKSAHHAQGEGNVPAADPRAGGIGNGTAGAGHRCGRSFSIPFFGR